VGKYRKFASRYLPKRIRPLPGAIHAARTAAIRQAQVFLFAHPMRQTEDLANNFRVGDLAGVKETA
jgi:hypothetical protein